MWFPPSLGSIFSVSQNFHSMNNSLHCPLTNGVLLHLACPYDSSLCGQGAHDRMEDFAFLTSYDISNTWSWELQQFLNFNRSENALSRSLSSKLHINWQLSGRGKQGRKLNKGYGWMEFWVILNAEVKYMGSIFGGSLPIWVFSLPLYPCYPAGT